MAAFTNFTRLEWILPQRPRSDEISTIKWLGFFSSTSTSAFSYNARVRSIDNKSECYDFQNLKERRHLSQNLLYKVEQYLVRIYNFCSGNSLLSFRSYFGVLEETTFAHAVPRGSYFSENICTLYLRHLHHKLLQVWVHVQPLHTWQRKPSSSTLWFFECLLYFSNVQRLNGRNFLIFWPMTTVKEKVFYGYSKIVQN